MYYKLLISNIIGHGFLDFYNPYFKNNIDFLKTYLLIIFLNLIWLFTFSGTNILIFIIFSFKHFGDDMVYLTNDTNLLNLGSTLFLCTIINDYQIWYDILNILADNHIHHIIIVSSMMGLLSVYNIRKNILGIKILICQLILSKILGLYNFILIYMNIFHIPIALHKIYILNGKKPILLHLLLLFLVYQIPLIINKLTLRIGISIVNAHMIIRYEEPRKVL